MSGIPEEGIYGNVASQSSNVSQGGRRRTRSEFEGDTDYSSTTRRRLEGMYRPQWTMSSSVEDILLEGTTNRTDMKLNDFLRSNLGGRVAVDEDYNVTMQAFVLRPTMFINDSEILGIITTLPSYRELEAINKLHDEGVFSLGQWKVFKSKNTVAPLAKGKLNAAFTEVLRKEKARREEEEKARRDQQQINLNLTLSIKDAIFQGRARFYKKKMNDFLTLELDGRGVADTNRRVLLKEFFKEPARYIHDAGVLNEIKKTDAYLRAERAVREEMDMEKDIKDLEYNHLSTLLGWSLATAEIKASVHDITKRFLDAALEEAKKPTTTIAPIEMEGFYESVYNASWHHVVEVPGGEGTGMEVREGKPPQSWTYKAVSRTLEKDDGVEQSGAPRLRLMVLTSDDEWPYTWKNDGRNISDCYVDCEVERVWQIVKGNLTGLFSAYEGTKYIPKRHVLIGTPGIGKSMNAGSYLLYQLLHYDAEELPMVAYVIADRKFLFDKTAKTVKKHGEASSIVDILDEFSGRGVKGYIIYDVAKPGHEPPAGLPCKGWGMIVVTSPNEGNFKEWEKQKGSVRIVMNCPAKEDVKAMCVCMNRNEPTVQAGYWRKVEGRMDKVGPLLRYVFDQATYKDRIVSCRSTINKMVLQDTQYYSVLGTDKMCEGNHVSHKLVKVVRVRGKEDAELPYNALISSHLAELTLCKLAELMVPNDFNLLVLAIKDDLLSKSP
ncbi:putative retrotransposon hot spot (RHS) protein [Trypanosoma cruzi]|nr:putative retrotransposon hot spot (RHS) protein [Trypanosoma cruzi]